MSKSSHSGAVAAAISQVRRNTYCKPTVAHASKAQDTSQSVAAANLSSPLRPVDHRGGGASRSRGLMRKIEDNPLLVALLAAGFVSWLLVRQRYV